MAQQYQYPPQQPAYVPQSSTLALVSMICGFLGWTLLPGVGSIIAVITGHMAKSEINRSGGRITGSGMATIGLILGYLSIALGLVAVCLLIILPLLGVGGIAVCAPFTDWLNQIQY